MSNKGATKYSGKYFSILGDSISTLKGYNPEGYSVFYEGINCVKSGVSAMEDTWWGKVVKHFGGELLVNNSWSGSQVAKVQNQFGLFPSGCSDERTNGLHKGDKYPDVIIVYIGTNDWARAVQPEIKIVGWRNENTSTSDDPLTQKTIEPKVCGSTDETVFSIAYSEMIRKIAHNYPNAEIWCCTLNTTFMSNNPTFKFPFAYQGEHIETYNKIIVSQKSPVSSRVQIIDLYSCHTPYDSIDGSHPTAEGMKTIASLIINLIENQLSKEENQRKWASFSFVDENGKIHETYGYYENYKDSMKNDTFELDKNVSLDFKEIEKIVIEYSEHHYEFNTNNWEVLYKNYTSPADADDYYPQDFFEVKTVCLNRKVIKTIKKLFKSFFVNYTFQERLKLLPPGAMYEVYIEATLQEKTLFYSNTHTMNLSIESDPIPEEIKRIVELLDLYCDFIKYEPKREIFSYPIDVQQHLNFNIKNTKKNYERILGLKYLTTGVIGYDFFDGEEKICTVSSLVGPESTIVINCNGKRWNSGFDNQTIVPGLTRFVSDEKNKQIFKIVYISHGKFEINDSVSVYCNEEKYSYFIMEENVAQLRLVRSEIELTFNEKDEYDKDIHYEAEIIQGIDNDLMAMMLAFPTLRFI